MKEKIQIKLKFLEFEGNINNSNFYYLKWITSDSMGISKKIKIKEKSGVFNQEFNANLKADKMNFEEKVTVQLFESSSLKKNFIKKCIHSINIIYTEEIIEYELPFVFIDCNDIEQSIFLIFSIEFDEKNFKEDLMIKDEKLEELNDLQLQLDIKKLMIEESQKESIKINITETEILRETQAEKKIKENIEEKRVLRKRRLSSMKIEGNFSDEGTIELQNRKSNENGNNRQSNNETKRKSINESERKSIEKRTSTKKNSDTLEEINFEKNKILDLIKLKESKKREERNYTATEIFLLKKMELNLKKIKNL
jgi:hypothetical protein